MKRPPKHFVSEAITPIAGTFSSSALAAGEPSLPEAFSWRGKTCRIMEILAKEKIFGTESFSGEKYLRRHRYRLRMDDESVWDVYFARQPLRSGARGSTSPRWFLQTIETGTAGK
jgi:hypothetical protein